NVIWRMMGVRIGRRVFDDGVHITERTLTTIGDDCVLNTGSKIQCHSQEDGTFKSDRSSLRAGCTIGVGAIIHYGVTMGDGSVRLTANAKVLGARSGEREASTGYAALEGRSPLLCRMTTEPHSWRAMLLEINRAESELLSQKEFPVDDLRRELGLIKPLFETVFALTAGDGAELAEETVLRVGFVEHDGLVLRLRYKTDVLDADCAARIAGYHVTALALIAADPDAEHARQALLSAEELRFQLNGLG